MQILKKTFIFFLFLTWISCGGGNSSSSDLSNSIPILITLTPNPASPGTTLSIQGNGFSPNLNENFLSIGSFLIPAQNYSLVHTSQGNLEQLDFSLPATLTTGTYSLFILVRENPSNSLNLILD